MKTGTLCMHYSATGVPAEVANTSTRTGRGDIHAPLNRPTDDAGVLRPVDARCVCQVVV